MLAHKNMVCVFYHYLYPTMVFGYDNLYLDIYDNRWKFNKLKRIRIPVKILLSAFIVEKTGNLVFFTKDYNINREDLSDIHIKVFNLKT
jgi:hypothetical protein